MKKRRGHLLARLTLGSVVVGSALISVAAAQEGEAPGTTAPPSIEPLFEAQGELRQTAVAAQQQVDRISGARLDLLAEYRKVQKELEIQQLYNEQIRAQIAVQEAKKKELEVAILGVDRLQRQIPPLAARMLDSLESYIKLDLPFRTEERLTQLERVRASLSSADIKPSEQLRQILELYDIELQYSRTIETYDQFVEIGGTRREVSILRWGRMALIYLTSDESAVGIYDPERKAWKSLPVGFRNAVRQGLRMARKQASLDLLLLPTPQPTRATDLGPGAGVTSEGRARGGRS